MSQLGRAPGTTGGPPTLLSLPPPLLDPILALAIEHGALSPASLLVLSRDAHSAARRVLARSLTLPDDDNILLDAQNLPSVLPSEGQSGLPSEGSPPSLLKQVANYDEWAHDVRSLQVVRPVVPTEDTNGHTPPPVHFSEDDDEEEEDVPVPPLDDVAFFLLLSRLGNLTSFAWSSYRLPPEAQCLALGQACKGLTSFSLDLLPSPFTPAASDHPAPGSPQLGTSPVSPSLMHGNGLSGASTLRWDAPHLSALPLSITHLALSHLSATGARALAAALPCFPALETLELARTLFVDDQVLAAVGAGAKALRRLVVREMGGTKLSEAGLQALFEGCESLEALELECVEGRFSRACWSKLAPLPLSLHTLRLVYSEQAPHKSWVVDHLSSLPAILGADASSLHTLSITRRPHPAALVPGSHHLARYPIEGVVEPRPLGAKAIDALVEREEGGREWRVLELDLFLLNPDALKRVLDGAPGLQRLQILFDSSFRNLLALAPSFAACPSLRHCLVSVPPQHTPELAPLTPAEYLAAVPPLAAAPAPGSPPIPSSAPRSTASGKEPKEDKHHPLRALDPVLPPTRDWRRFCKKAHSVERVAWIGRGGVGSWTFSPGRPGSSLTRVEFEPTRPVLPAPVPLGSSSTPGWGWGVAGAATSAGMGTGTGRRRSSTVSLAETCLSHLSLTSAPSSPSTSLLATPPPPPLAPMSFAAAGNSVSPRAAAAANREGGPALAASPPGLEFGHIGGAGAHRRRASSASGPTQGGDALPHSGGALGFAMPLSIPGANTGTGWASPSTPATESISPRSFAAALGGGPGWAEAGNS